MTDAEFLNAENVKLAVDYINSYAPHLLNYIKKIYKKNYVNPLEFLSRYYYVELRRFENFNTIYKHPTPIVFDDVYIPLTIKPEPIFKTKQYLDNVESNMNDDRNYEIEIIGDIKTVVIDEFPYDLFERKRRILIKDTAGMGKSTISKKLFKEALRYMDEQHVVYLPLFVELRLLSDGGSLEGHVYKKFTNEKYSVDVNLVDDMLRKANFIIFFDGFDEVPVDRKNEVVDSINYFTSKYPIHTYVLSSRSESALSNFGNFFTYTIVPLEIEQSYELIRRYGGYSKVSERLIETIVINEDPSIVEYLENPLLVSLLYFCYCDMNYIPKKRHLFYQKVYEALFRNHDISKNLERELKTKLYEDDFQWILGFIAFHCIPKGYVELTKNQLYMVLDEFKRQNPNMNFNNIDFLHDCTSSVPIFIEEGNLRWVHKSMRDYFAATYWSTKNKSNLDVLRQWSYGDSIHDNYSLLQICTNLDQSAVAETVLIPLLKEFSAKYYNLVEYMKGGSSDVPIRSEIFDTLWRVYKNVDFITYENTEPQRCSVNKELEALGFEIRYSEVADIYAFFNMRKPILGVTCFGSVSERVICVVNMFRNIFSEVVMTRGNSLIENDLIRYIGVLPNAQNFLEYLNTLKTETGELQHMIWLSENDGFDYEKRLLLCFFLDYSIFLFNELVISRAKNFIDKFESSRKYENREFII